MSAVEMSATPDARGAGAAQHCVWPPALHRRSARFLENGSEITAPASVAAELLQHGKLQARAGRIASAVEVFERALAVAEYKRDVQVCAGALDWLSWLAWIDLDGSRTSVYAHRMRNLELPPTSPEAFRLHIRQATQTLQLGDARLALAVLERAEHAGRDADIDAFTAYLSVKADVFAALGDTSTALSHARLAIDIADKRSDRYSQWRRLEYFGYIQYASGKLQQSMATYLSAEAAARSAALTWEVPFSRVRAAWVALLLGQFVQAHALIRACFDSHDNVQWMVVTRAWVGLTIGLAVADADLVERCSNPAYLATALESGDSYTLARTVAAFHAYYVRTGNDATAARLLRLVVPTLKSPDCALSLFEAIAQYGDADLRAHASALLAAFPDGHIMARAYRLLFASVTARRDGAEDACERLASQAQLAFEDTEHYYHAARCIELAGRRSQAHQRYLQLGAVQDARRTATARARRGRPRATYEIDRQRREVLDLLLAGATTTAIAEQLGFSVRTIKHRVAEIFTTEAVSSRAELARRYDLRAHKHAES